MDDLQGLSAKLMKLAWHDIPEGGEGGAVRRGEVRELSSFLSK